MAVILKNNARYIVMEFSRAEQLQEAPDEDVMSIPKRLIEQNREAYKVLAQ